MTSWCDVITQTPSLLRNDRSDCDRRSQRDKPRGLVGELVDKQDQQQVHHVYYEVFEKLYEIEMSSISSTLFNVVIAAVSSYSIKKADI